MQTLTITGPLGASTPAGSIEHRIRKCLVGVVAVHHLLTPRPLQPRALLGRADGFRHQLAPVRCTPPRRRLQSTVRDGRSPGSRVAAISRLPGTSQWHWRGLVAYSCGGSAGVEILRLRPLAPASLSPSTGKDHRRERYPQGSPGSTVLSGVLTSQRLFASGRLLTIFKLIGKGNGSAPSPIGRGLG